MLKDIPTFTCKLDDKKNTEKNQLNVIFIPLFEDNSQQLEDMDYISGRFRTNIAQLIEAGDFRGKENEVYSGILIKEKKLTRFVLTGLGTSEKISAWKLRNAVAASMKRVRNIKLSKYGIFITDELLKRLSADVIGQVVIEGAMIGYYKYDEYISEKDNQGDPKKAITILIKQGKYDLIKKGMKKGQILAEAQNLARSLANKPTNEINPTTFVKFIRKIARSYKLKCTVFDTYKLKRLGMNAILAVGSGSANKPYLVLLEYRGNIRKKSIDLAIVGKTITFDSGGLSLKPAQSMETMKFDKAGGCSVIGVMSAISRLKPKINVLALIPIAENIPSATSYKPGDIIKTFAGKTVEVQNTDAEGRLILADALSYANQKNPTRIIDIATLTGGCVVALGKHRAGIFANNKSFANEMKEISEFTGEKVWELPSDENYLEQMKSKVADLKNTGGREGSPCTAAAFLREFVKDTPWVHFDIAGLANLAEENPFMHIGATGFGVRTITEYALTIKD